MHDVINLKEVTPNVPYEGLVLIHSYDKKLDDSKRPLNGMLQHQGKLMKFKIWDASLQAVLNQNDIKGKIVRVSAKGGTYLDETDLTITSIDFNHGFTDLGAFMKSVDIPVVFNQFARHINENLSQNGTSLITELFQREQLFEPYKHAWAGMRQHDAQIGGLMNHVLKMLNLSETLIKNDPRLQPYRDFLNIGIIVHDIGKLIELDNFGNYTKLSFVGHRTIGVEMMSRNKDLFLKYFDEHFFYHILEILTGHHGKEFGDQPKTVWAYVISLIDMLESQTTGLMDRLDNQEVVEQNGNPSIRHDGIRLVL